MRPKATFATTSSKSRTSKGARSGAVPSRAAAASAHAESPEVGLSRASVSYPPAKPAATGTETPIQFVKGVGPLLGAIFNSRDIFTVKDLLSFFPRAYEDRTRLLTVSELVEN